MKDYPLSIINAGEDTYIVMSKGHHDPAQFMAAVRADYSWPLGVPKHVWCRSVPTRDPYRRCAYVFAEPNARGAFPATYSWEAYGDDIYENVVASEASTQEKTNG